MLDSSVRASEWCPPRSHAEMASVYGTTMLEPAWPLPFAATLACIVSSRAHARSQSPALPHAEMAVL